VTFWRTDQAAERRRVRRPVESTSLTNSLITRDFVSNLWCVTDTAVTAGLLGDPTRVRILEVLTAGPMRTSELAAATEMSPAALSRHLNLLRKAEVIARRDVADDGRGRAYELQPGALDALAGWLRSTSWAAELAAVSEQPQTRELLARMGGFLDAFAASDVGFFERHLRPDAVLVFPGTSGLFDKRGCLDSVASHPPYRAHHILTEPAVSADGAAGWVGRLQVDQHDRRGPCRSEPARRARAGRSSGSAQRRRDDTATVVTRTRKHACVRTTPPPGRHIVTTTTEAVPRGAVAAKVRCPIPVT